MMYDTKKKYCTSFKVHWMQCIVEILIVLYVVTLGEKVLLGEKKVYLGQGDINAAVAKRRDKEIVA